MSSAVHIDELPHGITNFDFYDTGPLQRPFRISIDPGAQYLVIRVYDDMGHIICDGVMPIGHDTAEAGQFMLDLANARYP